MSLLLNRLKKHVVFFHKYNILIPYRGTKIRYYKLKYDKPAQRGKWFILTWFVAIPFVILGHVFQPLAKGGLPERRRADFRPYEYLRLRNKRFPWGDGQKSLFHNSYWNALPDGYEPDSDIYDTNKDQDYPCHSEKGSSKSSSSDESTN